MKKALLTLTAISLLFAVSYAQTPVAGGNVNGTWTLAGSPYTVMGSIMVPDGQTLTIEPGVTVIFEGTYKLRVSGRLLAIGTTSDSITFTATHTSNGWRSIRFDNTPVTNDTSRISYCKLEYGKATGTSPDDNGGAFYFRNFSKAIISNCLITNCKADQGGGGIYLENSNPPIINNTISNNDGWNVGGGIFCYLNSNPLIFHNTITGNSTYGNGGAGICCVNSNPTITNNTISYNTNSYSNGGGIWSNGSSPVISSNIISNNSAPSGGGISCHAGEPTIINNTITNNTAKQGGGILCNVSTNPTITNNTIANNHADNGGALYFRATSSPTIRNTLLWGNTAGSSGQQVNIEDEGSDPNFYYCDVQGGSDAFEVNFTIYTGTYQNNLDTVPLFVAASAGSGSGFDGVIADWSLQSASPCINAGDTDGTYPTTDIAGNPRVFDGIIDIGAYEFQGYVGIYSIPDLDALILYPNPVVDYLVIEHLQKSMLEISTVDGQLIKTTPDACMKTKIYTGDLPAGVYLLKSITANGITVKKFVKR